MIISVSNHADRIRLIAIETMKGAFGIEGALRFSRGNLQRESRTRPFTAAMRPVRANH
jgi:hypothetical protein